MSKDLQEILKGIVLDNPNRVDRYDADYITDVHHILRERFRVNTVADFKEYPVLSDLKEVLQFEDSETVEDVSKVINEMDFAFDRASLSPKQTSNVMKQKFKYNNIPEWEEYKNVKLDSASEDSIEKIKGVQRDYSFIVSGKKTTFWGRPEAGGDIWSSVFEQLKVTGDLTDESNVLTIGPRFDLEIHFFRDTLGFKNTIGLDLQTEDESLIRVGDMHRMPFEDNSFDMVYQKNTFNKSYDIRKALQECVRVLRPGGILVSDECLDYIDGVSEIARTNIVSNQWYLDCLQDNIDLVIFNKEWQASASFIRKSGGIAVRIKK